MAKLMSWVSSENELPEHEEHVLVQSGNDCALAIYDADKKVFIIQRDGRIAKIGQIVIHWMRLVRPEGL
jgi:hypothetical protein